MTDSDVLGRVEALEAQVRHNIDPWVAEAELRPAIYNAVRKLTGMAAAIWTRASEGEFNKEACRNRLHR